MRLMENLERKRQAKVEEQIVDSARFVATELVDLINDERMAPYSLSVGTKPKGLSSEDYLSRVNNIVERCMARVGMNHLISYDPESTEDANTVLVNATPQSGVAFSYEAKELTIIYNKP